MKTFRRVLGAIARSLQLYHPLRDLRRDRRFAARMRPALAAWQQTGRPVPPPDAVKHACIRRYAKAFGAELLVETGTFYGDTIFALRNCFREIHSIELAPALHRSAVEQLGHLRHIHLHLGDSGVLLPEIVRGLDRPTLYWLDGHFCAGPSARGNEDSPISAELSLLLSRPPRRDVVLIDDARLFDGTNSYPTVEAIRAHVQSARPEAKVTVENDIICIAPV